MITTVLAHRGGLACGALAFVLSQHADIDVVAQLYKDEDVEPAVRALEPSVTVIDLDLVNPDGLPVAWTLQQRVPETAMLVLAEQRRSGVLGEAMTGRHRVDFLAKDGPPDRLAPAVRSLARGRPVRDPRQNRGSNRPGSPLTAREREVLWVAANGAPVREIAATLRMSAGTVQNHLSRIIGKTGARGRVQAINVAREAGWI
ncbi:MAG TPA: response regulator transcription factor [Micromonosporaceae bacterium]|nr:response regulator transcription factor [Micromonosporaceae bacterium]